MTNNSSVSVPESAIHRGIKSVGVGKKGSKSLTAELVQEVLAQLKSGTVSETAKGAFFAGLLCKGLTDEEKILSEYFPPDALENPHRLAQILGHDAPSFIQEICGQLLAQKEIDKKTAYQLGKFLLSDLPGDGARGIAASALRVRYETAEEYEGLLESINETITSQFREPIPAGDPIIQLAEPFDGVDHNYMLTPCLTHFLQKQNYRVVTLVGRNSGPKFCNNLYDLVQSLALPFLTKNADLILKQPPCGWYIDQKDLSPALDRWVDIRREIIKRPFLATLEKFLNPCQADIIIMSAFHGVYGDKMGELAERAGFPGSIVVRNGVEGTIAFPLTRPAKILCSARQKDGQYIRHEILFDALAYLKIELANEEKLDNPSITINGALIQEYLASGQTTNSEYNYRIAATCAGIQQGIDWINHNKGG